MTQAVILRVDAGGNIGMGHLMRCIALAQAIERAGIKALFLINTQTLDYVDELNKQSLEYFVLKVPENSSCVDFANHFSATESELLQLILNQYQVLFWILDGYHFSLAYRHHLKLALLKYKIKLALIDDNGGEQTDDLIQADWIINTTCMDDSIPPYQDIAPDANILAGENYRLLRSEFVNQTPSDYKARSGIVVTMGGTDPLDYTTACLNVLNQLNLTEKVTVLISSGFKHGQALCKQIKQLPKHFCYLYQADNMASVFANAKFVISAAGGTQFELYAMQTPSILLVSFDNQSRNSQAAKLQGWAEVLDFRQGFNHQALSSSVKNILDDNNRIRMQQNMLTANAHGADNLIKALFKHVK